MSHKLLLNYEYAHVSKSCNYERGRKTLGKKRESEREKARVKGRRLVLTVAESITKFDD